jgi:hypothetical protein
MKARVHHLAPYDLPYELEEGDEITVTSLSPGYSWKIVFQIAEVSCPGSCSRIFAGNRAPEIDDGGNWLK